MALREEFEKTGARLFRGRSYLPLLLLLMFLPALKYHHYFAYSMQLHRLWEGLCLCISYFGFAIRAKAIGHAPCGTSGCNTHKPIAASLTTTGAYSVVRNPLYLGNFIIWLGPSLFVGNWYLTFIYVLLFWLYYERIVFAEEAFLRDRFGQLWSNWADRTPAFIPRFRTYCKPDSTFSWRAVLSREHNGLLGATTVMLLFEFAGDSFVSSRLTFDSDWYWLWLTIFMLWSVLRLLKKCTNVLQPDERHLTT